MTALIVEFVKLHAEACQAYRGKECPYHALALKCAEALGSVPA